MSALGTWFPERYAPDGHVRRHSLNEEEIRTLFATRSNLFSEPSSVDDIIGNSLHAFGKHNTSIEFRVTCGSYSPNVTNSCVVDLGEDIRSLLTGAKHKNLLEISKCFVRFWEPDSFILQSRVFRKYLFDTFGRQVPQVGWITYVKTKSLPELPADTYPVTVKDGFLIVIDCEQFSGNDKTHIASALKVRDKLMEQSLI